MVLAGCGTTVSSTNTAAATTSSGSTMTPVSTLAATTDTVTPSPQTSFFEDVPPPAPVPWPDIANYIATTNQINVTVGEEFAIGMYASGLPAQFTKSFDQNYLALVDDQVVDYLPVTTEGTEWFLFKAINPGTTEIVFQYPLEYMKTFKITITNQ
jgi:hypothetical protein